MAKTARFNYKVFAAQASLDQMGVVGSLRAGAPAYSLDPEDIQSLINYEQGWFAVSMGDNSPCMEDQNGIQHVNSKAVFYLYEMGIPEWNAETEYQLNSFVNLDGVLFISLQNVNIGHAVAEGAWWARWSQPRNVVNYGPGTGDWSVAKGVNTARVNCTGAPGGVATTILPPMGDLPIGYRVTVKNISTSAVADALVIKLITGNSGTETIDGVLGDVFLDCFPSKEFITLEKGSALNWDIVG